MLAITKKQIMTGLDLNQIKKEQGETCNGFSLYSPFVKGFRKISKLGRSLDIREFDPPSCRFAFSPNLTRISFGSKYSIQSHAGPAHAN